MSCSFTLKWATRNQQEENECDWLCCDCAWVIVLRVLVLCAYLGMEYETRFPGEKRPRFWDLRRLLFVTEGILTLFHLLFLRHDSGSIVSLIKDNLFYSLSFSNVPRTRDKIVNLAADESTVVIKMWAGSFLLKKSCVFVSFFSFCDGEENDSCCKRKNGCREVKVRVRFDGCCFLCGFVRWKGFSTRNGTRMTPKKTKSGEENISIMS